MDEQNQSFSFRWGIDVLDCGSTSFPNHFWRVYHQVLTKEEWLFICHLATYKYESGRGECRPSLHTVAAEMGYKNVRSVQKLRAALEEKTYQDAPLLVVRARTGHPNLYDFSGLSRCLVALSLQEGDESQFTPEPQFAPPMNPSSSPHESQFIPPMNCGSPEESNQDQIKNDDHDGSALTDLIDLAGLHSKTARAILAHYGAEGATRWLAFVLDEHKANPAAYLYTCCVKKHDPPPASLHLVDAQSILARIRQTDESTPSEPPPWATSLPEPPLEIRQYWRACQSELELQMTRASYDTWIRSLTIQSLDRDACTATLQAPNSYIAEWITKRLAAPIIRTMAGVAELDADAFTFTCTVAASDRDAAEEEAVDQPAPEETVPEEMRF